MLSGPQGCNFSVAVKTFMYDNIFHHNTPGKRRRQNNNIKKQRGAGGCWWKCCILKTFHKVNNLKENPIKTDKHAAGLCEKIMAGIFKVVGQT